MTYRREIPRDLFNEAMLLKCLGQLALFEIDRPSLGLTVTHHPPAHFVVEQDDSDGSFYVRNVDVHCRAGGPGRGRLLLWHPLNSRRPWALLGRLWGDTDSDPVEVFTAEGEPTAEFLALLGVL